MLGLKVDIAKTYRISESTKVAQYTSVVRLHSKRASCFSVMCFRVHDQANHAEIAKFP